MTDWKYELIGQGIDACNELLLALTCRNRPSTQDVRAALGIDPDTGKSMNHEDIAKIIGAGVGRRPVTMDALRKFFNRAIRKIHEKGTPYVSRYKAIKKYWAYCNSRIGLDTIIIPNTDELRWIKPVQEILLTKKEVKKIVNLLDLLNCSNQRDVFTTALKDGHCFYNCPVIAHAPIPQDLLLRRLISILKHRLSQTPNIQTIDLGLQCPEYDDVLKLLNIEDIDFSRKGQVIDKICDSKSLNVLIIRNYQGMEHVSDIFLNDLLQQYDLRKDISRQTNLIIFWVGNSYPAIGSDFTQSTDHLFIDLPELDEINASDINQWATEYRQSYGRMANVCTNNLEQVLPNWGTPLVVLSEICKQLEVNGGIKTIYGLWKI
jgi:hypothetical protein